MCLQSLDLKLNVPVARMLEARTVSEFDFILLSDCFECRLRSRVCRSSVCRFLLFGVNRERTMILDELDEVRNSERVGVLGLLGTTTYRSLLSLIGESIMSN